MMFFPDNPSGLELVRQVAARGSTFLAELPAILMVLELSDFFSSLQIFCDSQSAVEIITLNWASNNFTVLISQIKSLIHQLRFQYTGHWDMLLLLGTKLLPG